MERLTMAPNKTKGILISFCGLDGCGKSTMIRMLREWFSERRRQVTLTKQPTDLVRNSDIFRTFMDEADHTAFDYRSLSLLAASDRLQHVSKFILPRLAGGDVVISDRYFYSCIANLRARGFTKDRWIFEIARHILLPDLAFFLDVPVETAVERVRTRPEEQTRYIDLELQYRLREEYRSLSASENGVFIPSGGTPEETFQLILRAVRPYFSRTISKFDRRT